MILEKEYFYFVVKRRLNKPTNDGGINNWLHVGF
jgi:hypothetical protein